MIVLPSGSAAHYYGKSTIVWNAFQLAAVLYSAVSNLAVKTLSPIGFRNLLPTVSVLPMAQIGANNKKVAIVTGSNTGIGLETAQALVERGYEVVLACRSRDKAQTAIKRIRSKTPNAAGKAVFHVPLDLSSIQSVNAFSKIIQEKYEQIDLLVNNAGLNSGGKSERNFDKMFQTNYLGHFLLTNNLMEKLLAADNPRVVNLSSVMHHFCQADKLDRDYWTSCALFGGRTESSYSPSKLAMLLFSIELNRRFRSKGLRSIAVNPGAVNSDIWRNKPAFLRRIFQLVYLDNKQGCHTTVAACVISDLPADANYLQPYHQVHPTVAPWPPLEMLGVFVGHLITEPRLPKDGSNGEKTAQVLWETSEELLETKF